MTKWQQISAAVFFASLGLNILTVTVYDFWVYRTHGNNSTVTVALKIMLREWPIAIIGLVFALGVLFGHLFWGRPAPALGDEDGDGVADLPPGPDADLMAGPGPDDPLLR
jgi:hypothetical protein